MACAQASVRVLAHTNVRKEQALLIARSSRFHVPKSSFKQLLPMRPHCSQGDAQPDTSRTAPQLQHETQKHESHKSLLRPADTSRTSALAESPRINFLDNWDPFNLGTRNLRQMMGAIDRIFGEIATPNLDFAYMRAPWDVVEDDDSYQLRIDLPGFAKDEVKVYIDDGVLVVNAHRNKEKIDQQEKWRTRDSFRTKMSLPKNIDTTKLHAKVNNGVLEVYIPKSKTTKKPIDVKIE